MNNQSLKHTPSPWVVESNQIVGQRLQGKGPIAHVYGFYGPDRGESEANIKLVKAAPEMYKYGLEMLQWLNTLRDTPGRYGSNLEEFLNSMPNNFSLEKVNKFYEAIHE